MTLFARNSFFSVLLIGALSQSVGALSPADLANGYDLNSLSRNSKSYTAQFESSVEIERTDTIGLHVLKTFDMGSINLDRELSLRLGGSDAKVYRSYDSVAREGALVVEKTDKKPFLIKLRKLISVNQLPSKGEGFGFV